MIKNLAGTWTAQEGLKWLKICNEDNEDNEDDIEEIDEKAYEKWLE